MRLAEIMTAEVVTAPVDAEVLDVALTMRDRSIGSVVLVNEAGEAVAIVTDRDIAMRVVAEGVLDTTILASEIGTRPVHTGEPDMELEEAAALMVRHRVRRLPIVEGRRLVGIVTLDDIAVRTGDLEVAKRMTSAVIEGALPGFYFRDRGG